MLLESSFNAEEKSWYGPESHLYYPTDKTISEVLFEALQEHPTNKCQISHDTGKVFTNAEVLTTSIRLAQCLSNEGLRDEDIVGLLTRKNDYETHVVFACFFNATPFHAVNPMMEPDAIAAIYAITKPKLIFCDGHDYELVKSVTRNWAPKICTLDNHIANVAKIEDLLASTNTVKDYRPRELVRGADQTMAIICTSGTTGLPKAVTLTNAQLLLVAPTGGVEDVIYSSASFNWISAIKTLLITTISGATRIVSRQQFSTELFVEIVRKHKVTTCSISHWQFHEVFSSPLANPEYLSSLQFVAFGGGWVSAGVLQAAQRVLENAFFTYIYGTTETDVVSVVMNPQADNLVGKLLPGRIVRIVSEQGVALGPNEMGEILIKTNQNWNGYYGNPEQTARTLDSAGWFHMGDLGYFDSEHNLHVVDRKKDLLQYKSMLYTPNEIERIIIELPDVHQVCVVGIKDRLHGDAAGALVIKKPGSLLNEKEVIEHVAKRITVEYKQLHAGVRFVSKLPLNGNSKVLRNVAREMFQLAQMPKPAL